MPAVFGTELVADQDALIPVASAMARKLASRLCSPNSAMAGSRIRAAAVRPTEHYVLDVKIVNNMNSVLGQGCGALGVRKSWLFADCGQQPVAEWHQRRGELLVFGDESGCLANRGYLGIACRGITGPSA
ncbi:hypothetical protein MLPF_1477 [Mycobacterium lepromatosis]|nr:hypothetical protein MLPF_1477 [Mycobacterium lepromatosis]